jgi:hypothetical protein
MLTEEFLKLFSRLPDEIKVQARKNYRLWKANPRHSSLQFKGIHAHEALYSCRVTRGWRVLGLLDGDTIHWFWIGSHADYESLLKTL